MPHDKNGRLIEVGDVVKGKGYNIKHEIIGTTTFVNPDTDSCNLQVAVVKARIGIHNLSGHGMLIPNSGNPCFLTPEIEYGACKDFEIIQKFDGSELK